MTLRTLRQAIGRNPVAFTPNGARTDLWRHLSYAVGDPLASRCCVAMYVVLRASGVSAARLGGVTWGFPR